MPLDTPHSTQVAWLVVVQPAGLRVKNTRRWSDGILFHWLSNPPGNGRAAASRFCLFSCQALCFGPPPKNAPAWHPRELLAGTKCAQSTHCTYYAIVSVFEAVVLWKWKRHIGRENLTNPHCLREVFQDNFFAGCNEKILPFEYGYPGSPNTIFLCWFTHHPFFIVRVCHHPKRTTIKKTGKASRDYRMIGSSGLIVITHPKFNKKSPWKSYKGTPKGNRHCLPTADGWNPAPPGISYLSTGAGFLPSTLSFFKGKLAAKLPRI